MAKRTSTKTPNRGSPAAAVATKPARKKGWLPAVLLLLAVVAAYSPLWQAGFIWDDDAHVTQAPLRSWTGLYRIWFDLGATQQYYPIVHSFFWIEHALWGDAPLGYHLVNIVLQGFSALLLAALLRRLEVPGAWLAAGIFALHPVQAESVAWVSELKNVLSGLLYFAAAWFYLNFDGTRKTGAYASALGLFVLALLAKSVVATLPAALLVVFWWKRGTLSWRRDVVPLLPFFTVAIFSGLFTAWVERTYVGAAGAEFAYSPVERSLVAGHALWFYFGKLLWPQPLIFIYPRWEIHGAAAWQYLFPLAILAVAGGLAALSRRCRGPLAGFLFFAGTLFPALGFFNVYPFRYSWVADHFQYLACLGVIVPVAAGLTLLAGRWLPERERMHAALGVLLLALLAALTWQRSWAFESETALWTDTLAKNPGCWMAANNLGLVYFAEGRFDDAAEMYQRAIATKADYADPHNNLGNILLKRGETDAAAAEFKKTIELDPHYAIARSNLGNIFARRGQIALAEETYRQAIAANPRYAGSYNNLGSVLFGQGHFDEAVAQFHRALEVDPGDAEAHANLGIVLLRTGSPDAAESEFRQALALDPRDAAAHYNLGIILLERGDNTDAIAEFRSALATDPQNADAHNNLGNALERAGQPDEAQAEFETAIRLDPRNAKAHANVGNGFLTQGRLDDAIAEYGKALAIDPAYVDAHYNLGLALMQKGNASAAATQFREVLKTNPGDPGAQKNLTRLTAPHAGK